MEKPQDEKPGRPVPGAPTIDPYDSARMLLIGERSILKGQGEEVRRSLPNVPGIDEDAVRRIRLR